MLRIPSPASSVRPIANAIRTAIAAATLGATGLVSQVHAQAPADTAPRPPATTRHYDIPAGPLPDALTRFSSRAGIYLAGATDLAKGRNSPGLEGDFSLQDGLAALLAGTGLQAVRLGNGGYGLREGSATPSEPAVSLRTTKVTAAEETDATTEGGGYAVSAVTMFGDTQSLKDIPSSVSVLTRQQMDDQNITTINDAMRYTTGVSSINYTGNNGAASAAYYNARGFPVDVALDGLSIVNGIQYMPQFDMAIYDRVEVFRGPSGLLNGQGDLGGSINLVRKMPTDSFQFRSETSAGSWNNYRLPVFRLPERARLPVRLGCGLRLGR